MKLWVLLVVGLILTSACSPKNWVYNERRQGNMHLDVGNVYFQKSFSSTYSHERVKRNLLDNNTPYGGLQVKLQEGTKINGTITSFQLNWDFEDYRKVNVPKTLRYPMNAAFSIVQDGDKYTVTVENIWFADMQTNAKQKNLTLESVVLRKDKLAFIKKRRVSAYLTMMDINFDRLFSNKVFLQQEARF